MVAALALVFAPDDTPIPHVVAFVVAHFFLFCNLVRLARTLELIWAAVFLLLATGTIAFDTHGWLMTYAVSSAMTMILIAIETCKPSYHGVGWRQINPDLPRWWQEHHGEKSSTEKSTPHDECAAP